MLYKLLCSSFVIGIFLCFSSCQNENEEITQTEALTSFAKLYGYVKYFHPSDEAQEIDWDKLAIYGTEAVQDCKTDEELIAVLNSIFLPIAPSVKLYLNDNVSPLLLGLNIDSSMYKKVYWQHEGVGISSQGGPYSSIRVNAINKRDKAYSSGSLLVSLNVREYQIKKFRFTGYVKCKENSYSSGTPWVRIESANDEVVFINSLTDNPLRSKSWEKFEISGEIAEESANVTLGCLLKGGGEIFLDDFSFEYENNKEWVSIPIENGDFETGSILSIPNENSRFYGPSKGYNYKLSEDEFNNGNKSARIKYVGDTVTFIGEKIFDHEPYFSDIIKEEIKNGILCEIPLVLYGDSNVVYPLYDETLNHDVINKIKHTDFNVKELSSRLGNVINIYNVFQHFFPYKISDEDWGDAFQEAIESSYIDKSLSDHLNTLKRMLSVLKDGHMSVMGGNSEGYSPPFISEVIENNLVVTDVLEKDLGIIPGDIIESVNDTIALDFFFNNRKLYSSPTIAFEKEILRDNAFSGEKDSDINLLVNGEEIIVSRKLEKEIVIDESRNKIGERAINDDIYYFNLDVVDFKSMDSVVRKIKQSKAIIFDLRGYPNGNTGILILGALMTSSDTTKAWLQVPQFVYPDRKNIKSFKEYEWGLDPTQPSLSDKEIFFITNSRAASHSESILGYVKAYKLGTIIGQPTAGTNGNINFTSIGGGIKVRWTGMKVVNHDGSQHFGVGVLPDVYVEKTIEGVKQGRDEFLEKAIELAKSEIQKEEN